MIFIKGFYLDPVLAIKERLEVFLNELQSKKLHDMKKVIIKVSCDGTNLSRNVKVVNVVFNIINEKLKAATSVGCYRIGIFKIDTEDYESVKEWLPTIWNLINSLEYIYYDKTDRVVFTTEPEVLSQMETSTVLSEPINTANLPSIDTVSPLTLTKTPFPSIDTNRFMKIKIEKSFSADYKMELIAMGMYAASGNWPCIYCTQHKDRLHLKGFL